jgi:tRNA-specific 2-thiouridylase
MTEFDHAVIEPFMEHYLHGTTPNPCIECNRHVKWAKMIDFARYMGADFIATGHYASIVQKENGRFAVKANNHNTKDQTYMLYKLTQEQLSRTLMPLGKLSKDEVRNIAIKAGLPVADKPDSQEICFVPDGHYSEYIEENFDGPLPEEGNFVDEDGNVLGTHKGIIHYTVGQRKGLGIAMGHPVFIKSINAETNEIVLSSNESLFTDKIICSGVNFMSIETPEAGETVRARVKIRYHHDPVPADVAMLEDGRVEITFDEKVRAATPGQSAVFYDDDSCVMGGGIIVKTGV